MVVVVVISKTYFGEHWEQLRNTDVQVLLLLSEERLNGSFKCSKLFIMRPYTRLKITPPKKQYCIPHMDRIPTKKLAIELNVPICFS